MSISRHYIDAKQRGISLAQTAIALCESPLRCAQIRRGILAGIGRCCLAFLILLSDLVSLQAASGPNILLVLVDDQSWNGTSVQMHPDMPNSRSDYYQTPRLEEFASQGMRFYNGYASQSMCSPTRAAILTGRSPAQLQMTDLPTSYPGNERWSIQDRLPLTPPAAEPLPSDAFTLPQIIKQTNPNYVTAHLGKWHLDIGGEYFPEDMGYDTSVRKAPYLPNDPKTIFHTANSANIFIEESVASGKPFFLQLSHRAVHDPIEFRPEIRDKYAALPRGTVHADPEYAAMTEDLDTSFGMVLDKLDQLGIRDNTYVIYTSDNAAPTSRSSSSPLYRGKSTIWEGGIRVPFIVRGPNVAAGSFSDVPVTTTDLFSTIATLTGFSGELPSNVEGADFSSVLHNAGSLPTGKEHLSRNFHEGGEIYWHWPQNFGAGPGYRIRPASAVRDGDFKLYLEYGEHGGPDTVRLYNLTDDISESSDLSASMPAKAAELRAKLNKYLEAVDASFAYDVKKPVAMNWDASSQGNVPNGWRSTIDIKYKGAETWKLGGDSQAPQKQVSAQFQPGLPSHAFHFDGDDRMTRNFFHVGDIGPRKNTPLAGTPDFNRSASVEMWVRFDSLAENQILFESGTAGEGISLTIGDADLDGMKNDLRFRVLGTTGAESGAAGIVKQLTVDAKVDRFANPTADFVHLAAVFNDDPTNRYAEVYVNGALAGRVNGAMGASESLRWDNYDLAGLGNTGGNGLGGNGGPGPLPFSGGLRGEVSQMRFSNFAVTSLEVHARYNSALHPAGHRITAVTGDTKLPTGLPTNVASNAYESEKLQVMHERSDILSNDLNIDAAIEGGETFVGGNLPVADLLPAGTRFSSYLFHFDPLGGSPSPTRSIQGSVSFAGTIAAIQWNSSTMAAADSVLGTIGNYGTLTRGLAFGAGDSLSVSMDKKTLTFDLLASGDELIQFRVLTAMSEADFNFDGFVDDVDLGIWQHSFGIDSGGDADKDGDTDGRDFLVWQRDLQPALDIIPGSDAWQLAQWRDAYGINVGGDFDGDGDTDGRDFLFWQRDETGQASHFAAVPEPGTIMLGCLALGSMACLRRRRVA